jgi:hypothetical protein
MPHSFVSYLFGACIAILLGGGVTLGQELQRKYSELREKKSLFLKCVNSFIRPLVII